MSSKILITGGLGNLGYWITSYFCKLGHDVFVLNRTPDKPDDGFDYKMIVADIEKLDALREALWGEFDYCIHLAGAHDYFEKDYFAKAIPANVLGTRNLIDVLSLKNSFKNFIYFSTFHVYGQDSGIIDETTPPQPKNDYAMTHYFCELYLKQFWQTKAFPSTIIRLSNGYGHPIRGEFTKWYLVLNDFAKTVFEKQEIIINSNGLGLRDFIWHGDVCDAVNKLMGLEPRCEIFNIASGFCHRIIDIANLVGETYEERCQIKPNIIVNGKDKGMPANLNVDIGKIKSKIEFRPSDKIKDEINAVFDYLQKVKS
jgi:UDP-glucose 4-epimerase